MEPPSVRDWTDPTRRKNAKDLWTAAGVIGIVAAILYSLPDLEVDLSPGLVLGVVSVAALIVLVARRFMRWNAEHRRRRHGRRL
jgi:hypothetical protein